MTLTKNQRYQPEVNVESTLACYLGRLYISHSRPTFVTDRRTTTHANSSTFTKVRSAETEKGH